MKEDGKGTSVQVSVGHSRASVLTLYCTVSDLGKSPSKLE